MARACPILMFLLDCLENHLTTVSTRGTEKRKMSTAKCKPLLVFFNMSKERLGFAGSDV